MRGINVFLPIIFFLIAGITAHAQENKNLNIAFLTDIHVSPGQESEPNLISIVDEINASAFDFVVVTGDLTNTGSDTELITVHRILSALKIPLHIIPGNHETNWSESACQTFDKLWGADKLFFRSGNHLFIGYSTGPYLKMGDGHIRNEDVRWVDNTLRKNYRKDDIVISLSHYPLGEGLDNWVDITGVLKKYNTRLSLCGHGHRLSFHNFDGIPGIMGRSSLPRGTAGVGYNIIDLRNDSVLCFEKIVGRPADSAFIAFSLLNPTPLKNKLSVARPNDSLNKVYNVKPFVSYIDSASVYTGPSISNTEIVYGTSQGDIKALDTKSRKIRWKKKLHGAVYSTPIVSGNTVIAGSIDGQIVALDAINGKEKWTLHTGTPVIGDGVSEDGFVYIGSGSGTMYKIDVSSGKLIWKNDSISGQLQGQPALSEQEIVFGAWDRHLYCLNKNTGQIKWTWDNGSPQKLYSPGNVVPAIANGKVFIVAPDRYMTAIDLSTGKTIWRDNSRRVRESMGISADTKTVYAKTMNDTVIAVSTDPDVFRIDWEVNAGFGYEHDPCPMLESHGIVYAGTREGVLIAIDARTHSVLWKHKAGNSSVNKIAADKKGNIWISLIEGKIAEYKPERNNIKL